ncbi:phage tail tape measure protein [Mycolicibacterium brisbanense]|uniref:Phage tail tape measure protein, family protein, core region n=1 Tax=Mycolicibacterium brisbanense TaxID=146020 RepID=A0A100W6P7_9MYCO|nr:phage tail tape measure protein [Mycolicibacterium brisbanense]MCV7158042.1 phage tail tape measure protein [Mycolicibacterium brisbanense]GAS92692.1 phage tail tape measure protein, family protein, core region [Mycolicibacterium brisbanense]
MGVAFDLHPTINESEAQQASGKVKDIFLRGADEISKGWGQRAGKIFDAMDGTKARAELDSLRRAYNDAALDEERAAQRMVRANGAVEASIARLAEVTEKYGAGHSKAIAAENALANARANSALQTKGHVDAMLTTEGAATALTAASAKAASTTSDLGRAANVAGAVGVAGLGIAMTATVKSAGDFEAAGQKIISAADMSADQVKILQDGILKLAGTNTYSAQQMLEASFGLAKMGDQFRTGAGALSTLKAAAQLASIEGIPDLNEVIKGLTISMNDYHIPTEKAADVATKLKVAVGDSGATLQEFSGSLHSVEPIASGFHIQLEDVYAALARYTKTGTSADQATENIRNSMNALKDVTSPAAQEMRKFGIDADDVSLKLKSVDEGGRGYIGTIQYLTDTVLKKFGDQTQINTGDIIHNATALENAKNAIASLPTSLQGTAQAILDGKAPVGELRKEIKGLNVEQANLVTGFITDVQHIDEFSKQFKNGRQTIEDVSEALKRITGTVAGQSVAEALFGDPERAKATLDEMAKLQQSQATPGGDIPGWADKMKTFNAEWANTKDAVKAVEVELGTAMLPTVKSVVSEFGNVARVISEHEALAKGLIYSLTALAGAWGLVKTAMVLGRTLDGLTKFRSLVADVADTAATKAKTVGSAWKSIGDDAEDGAAGVSKAADKEVKSADKATTAARETQAAMRGIGPAAEEGAAKADGALNGFFARNGGRLKGLASILGMVGTQFLPDGTADRSAVNDAAGLSWLLGPEVGIPATGLAGLYDTGRSVYDVSKAQHDLNQHEIDQANQNAAKAPDQPMAPFIVGQPTMGNTPVPAPGGKPPAAGNPLDDFKNQLAPGWKPPPAPAGPPAPAPTDAAPVATDGSPALGATPDAIPGSGGGSKKKSPEGTKEDPIYMAPIPSSGSGLGYGSKGTDPWSTYNPLEEHGKGGLLQQLTQMGTTFLAELALGNPLGQLMKSEQARRSRGESRSNPMYVVDANGNVMTKEGYDNYKRNFEIGQDQKVYDYDVKTYGADSAEAIAAQRELTKAQQEYAANMKAQAYDPRGAGGAYPGDAALLANIRPGTYSQDAGRDLLKGLSDCSSSVGDLVNIMDGRSTGGEKLTTANAAQWLPEHGFLPGPGGPGDFRVGYWSGAGNAGHMQATLPDGTPWNWGDTASAARGGVGGTGADDPSFTTHYYRPVRAGGGAPGPVGGLYGAANTNPALNNPMAPQGGDGAALPGLSDVPRYFGNGAPIKPGATTGYQGTRTPLGVMGTPKQNTGTGQGLGIGGGLLGLLMNAGSEAGAAAGAMPGLGAGGAAAGQVAQIALQEANRFAGYLGQLGGIAVSGLQETFLPDLPQTGTLSKILGGLAGAHPVTTDTADQAQQGQTPYDPNTNGQQSAPQLGADPDKQKGQDKDQQGGDQQPTIGLNIENFHNSPGSPDYLNLSKYGAGMTP